MTSYPIKVQSLGSCAILAWLLGWMLYAVVSNHIELCNCSTCHTSAMQLSVSDTVSVRSKAANLRKKVVLKFQCELGRIWKAPPNKLVPVNNSVLFSGFMIHIAIKILFGRLNQEGWNGRDIWHEWVVEGVRMGFWWESLRDRDHLEEAGLSERRW